ncbi:MULTISPECIES: hypothetical protein [unclassified Streptomyces]|uniref:hypothetical protein n=1 Tax=unclassified Streptomyces TaxID=2593676 RepID=UPI001447296F|nr:hypothetical protein [Streptomyces sp. McG7]
MGWSYKVHGGIALALSALFLLSAVLAWMPWASWPAGMTWMAAAALSLPVALAAVGRVLLTRADRKTLWLSFRCLPGRLQAVLGVLAVTGVLMAVIGASQENNLQTDGVEDGRHYVYDTTPPPPGTCRGLEQCLRGRTAAGAAQLDARLRSGPRRRRLRGVHRR